MNPILNKQDEAYLSGLQESPVWMGILKKLKNAESLPRYSPKMEEAFHLWIYKSGGLDATEGLLSLLSLKPITLKQEDKT